MAVTPPTNPQQSPRRATSRRAPDAQPTARSARGGLGFPGPPPPSTTGAHGRARLHHPLVWAQVAFPQLAATPEPVPRSKPAPAPHAVALPRTVLRARIYFTSGRAGPEGTLSSHLPQLGSALAMGRSGPIASSRRTYRRAVIGGDAGDGHLPTTSRGARYMGIEARQGGSVALRPSRRSVPPRSRGHPRGPVRSTHPTGGPYDGQATQALVRRDRPCSLWLASRLVRRLRTGTSAPWGPGWNGHDLQLAGWRRARPPHQVWYGIAAGRHPTRARLATPGQGSYHRDVRADQRRRWNRRSTPPRHTAPA